MTDKDQSLPIRLIVRFADPATEERFLTFYSAHYFRFIQFSLILGIALLLGDFVVDKLNFPDLSANWLRLTVCIPILAAGLAYTFVGSARKFWEPAMSLLIVAISIALFVTLHRIDLQGGMGLHSWVGILNFIFLEFYCFLILGIRFRYALIAGIAILSAFIVAIGYDDVQSYRQAYWSYHLFTLFLLAAGIGWWREFFLRKEFATRESLRTANESLTETALEHSRARSLIEATLEATDNGILVIDQQGKITSYNSRFLEMWQIPEALIAGADDRQLLEFVVGQLSAPQKFIDHIESLYKQPAATSRNTLHFTDGRIFARFSHPQRLDGEIVGRVWSFLDITEQYATEQRVLHLSEVLTKELEQSEQQRGQLQALLSAIPDLVWMKDADGVYRSCNPTFGLLAGAPVEQIIGKTDYDLFPAEAAAMFRVDDLAAAADRTPLIREERVIFSSDGHPALLETIKKAVRGKDGKLIGVLGIARDVTKTREVLNELEKARAAALNSNEAKSRFLANMSHEIRTPMNAIIGMAELCLATDLSARQRNYVSKIQTASNALLHVINDILDFSKIEAGKMQIEFIPFALEEVFEQLAAVLSLRAEDQGIELTFELDDRTPAQIIGDPLRLGQVLTNLVSNALKFSPGGNVRVQVEQVSETAKAVELRFAIHDQGIGMTEEQLAELFQPFKQADASTTRRFGGTGLGLAISNHLVSLMGGRIWAESKANVGSSFYFTLWFTRAETTGRSGIAELARRLGEHADRPVLVVDDNAVARSIIARNIEHLGFRTLAAASAEEALACVSENADEQYLCCFVDWHMKEVDGLETIKLLKHYFTQQPFAAPSMILVSAYSHHDDLKNIGDRIDGLLAKPITARHLYVELARCLGVFDPALASPPPKPGKSLEWSRFRGIDVLLVEDLEINQEVIVDLLANVEIYARVATNGAEALAEVARKVPDLILMDCQMPVMDGFTATRQLRANPLWKNIPVIALTANALTDDRKRCHEAGMNSHVAKPLRMEALFTAIANALPDHFSAASSCLPEAARKPGEMPSSDIPLIKGIDTAQGLIHVSGNTSLYRKLLRRFRDTTLAVFERQFSEAIDARDCATASRLAHSLKGVARTLGANDLGDAASALEATCSKHDGIACRVLLESTCLKVEQLIKAIDSALPAS